MPILCNMLHKIGKVFFRLLETNGFHVKARNEGFPVEARLVIRTSNMKIPRRHLADYVIKLHQKACPACSTIIFSLQPIKQFISSVVVLAVTPFSWDHCDEGFTLFPFIEEIVFIPFHSDTRKVSFSIYFPWKKKINNAPTKNMSLSLTSDGSCTLHTDLDSIFSVFTYAVWLESTAEMCKDAIKWTVVEWTLRAPHVFIYSQIWRNSPASEHFNLIEVLKRLAQEQNYTR